MENANEVLIPKIVDPKDYGLDEKQGSEVEKEFLPVITERENLTSIYSDIVSKEITREIEAEAYDLRLKLVKVRTNTDRIHKAAKAFYLAGGKFVDAWKNKNNTIIEQMEEKLKEIETTSARAERDRINQIESHRKNQLSEFCDVELMPVGLGLMREDVFNNYLTGLKIAYEAKKEAERKETEERLERERIACLHLTRKESLLKLWQFILPEHETINLGELSDEDFIRFEQDLKDRKQKIDAENEKIRRENERLRIEAERKEKELEAERKKQAEELAKQKAKAEHEARIQAKIAAKELAELQRKQRIAEEKAREERMKAEEERKKLESELLAKKQAEEKLRIEAERIEKEKIEALKKAEKAPDKEKLNKWIESLTLSIPELKSLESVVVANDIKEKFNSFKKWANSQIEKL